MNIVVCVKQVVDTEAVIALDGAGEVELTGQTMVIDPYSEFAVERAVQLKEELGGTVTLLTLGSQDCLAAVRHGLAMGADAAVLIEDEQWTARDAAHDGRRPRHGRLEVGRYGGGPGHGAHGGHHEAPFGEHGHGSFRGRRHYRRGMRGGRRRGDRAASSARRRGRPAGTSRAALPLGARRHAGAAPWRRGASRGRLRRGVQTDNGDRRLPGAEAGPLRPHRRGRGACGRGRDGAPSGRGGEGSLARHSFASNVRAGFERKVFSWLIYG